MISIIKAPSNASMNFTSLSNSTRNNTLIDGSTQAVLFTITTPSAFGDHATAITNTFGEVVGVYERESEQVIIRGQTTSLRRWLPPMSTTSR